MLNVDNLMRELKNENITVSGCSSVGIVWDVDGVTEIQNRPDVAAIIAAHDPTPKMQTEQVFILPIKTPKITTEEVVLNSPKPKTNAKDALAQAQLLASSVDKPIGEILLNLMVYITDLESRVKAQQSK